ncbi:uncharacterized protein LOC135377619 [Ornithodoros turicata]
MCPRSLMYALVSRLGVLNSKICVSSLPMCGMRRVNLECSFMNTSIRKSFSTSCSILLKDEAIEHKSGQDSNTKLPPIEPDDDTRSILNDIWHDFEYVPPKASNSPEDMKSSKAPLTPQSQDKKQQPKNDQQVRDLIYSAQFNAKKLYSEEDATVILDTLEKLQSGQSAVREDLDYYPENIKIDEFEGLNLTRGVTGVFDLDELIDVLRSEKLSDIAVVTVPKDKVYCDYIVVASAISRRQSKAVSEFLKKLYKRKRGDSDPALFIEGEDCPNWKALDMGNIVLHIFLPDTRAQYDLETLWTVGSNYDDLTHAKDDPVFDMLQQQIQLLENMKPLGGNSSDTVLPSI